jgi:hypothetical protein
MSRKRLFLSHYVVVCLVAGLLSVAVTAQTPEVSWGMEMSQTQVSIDPSRSEYAHIVIDSVGNKHIFWLEGRDGSPLGGAYWYGHIYYSKLDIQGNVLIDQQSVMTVYSCYCHITAAVDSEDNLHLAWTDGRLHAPGMYQYSNWEIYYKKLDNNGNTLIGGMRLTHAVYFSGTPYLTMDRDDNVHIVWADLRHRHELPGYWPTDIYYGKLDKNGNILVNNKRLTADYSGSGWPSIALDSGGNIHMVHYKKDYIYGPNNRRVFYSKMDNDGNLLIPEIQIGPIQSAVPGITVDSQDNLHIVWVGTKDGVEGDVWTTYYRKLDQYGTTLVNDKALCPGNLLSVAVGPGDTVHVGSIAYGNELYYYKLDSNGDIIYDNGGFPVDTTPKAFINLGNFIGVDSCGNVHMVWAKRMGSSSNTEVFYLSEADLIPPVIESISANPDVLWPPNHKMVTVTLSVDVSDNCGNGTNCQITEVSSNEPVNGPGDGNTAPDWEITGDLTVNLRAERTGKGSGRIYTITVMCTDASGNSSTGTVTVTAPHDKGKKK